MLVFVRIKGAIDNANVCYWKDRRHVPNIPIEQFLAFLIARTREIENLRWKPRLSGCPEHDSIGEDDVFQGNITVSELGQNSVFYIKGFFYPKHKRQMTQGIEVQSFRKETYA